MNRKANQLRGFILPLFLILFLVSSNAFSSESVSSNLPPWPTYALELGLASVKYDSYITFNNNVIDKPPISLEQDLGFSKSDTTRYLRGYWRYAQKHRLKFSYFPTHRNTTNINENKLTIDDKTILIGAVVDTDIRTNIIDIDYGYNFYQTDKTELTATLGLYWVALELDIQAVGHIITENEVDIISGGFISSAGMDAPMPLIGLSLNHRFNSRFELQTKLRLLDANMRPIGGRVINFDIGAHYYITPHIGIGLAADLFKLDLIVKNQSILDKLDWNHKDLRGYIKVVF